MGEGISDIIGRLQNGRDGTLSLRRLEAAGIRRRLNRRGAQPG
jgi:hypothetical protein